MLHVAFFGEMRRGNIAKLGGYQAIHRIAFGEISVGLRTKAAVAAGANVTPLRRAMK